MTLRIATVFLKAGLAIVFLGLLLTGHSRAHEWYPLSSCSGVDCHPADSANPKSREPKPRLVDRHWVLHDGTKIPEAAARLSPDEDFHVCRYAGNPNAAVIYTGQRPCFWAPAPTF
jgi:hypothetical protein